MTMINTNSLSHNDMQYRRPAITPAFIKLIRFSLCREALTQLFGDFRRLKCVKMSHCMKL